MIMNLLGGIWLKLLVLLGIVAAVLMLVLRIAVRAERAGKLEERAQQRIRNAKIKRTQEQDAQATSSRIDVDNIDDLLSQL